MKTKEMRIKVIYSVLILVGLMVAVPFVFAGSLEPSGAPTGTMKTLDEVEPKIPIHASDLPLTITEPNSYYLAETINFDPSDANAITIEANDVTIDLAGFSVIGPNSGTGCGVYMNGCTNVEIRNGTVRDFYCGIYEFSSSGRQHRVINVRVMSNGNYGIKLYGDGHMVKDCTAAENGYMGIYVSSGSTVNGSIANRNGNIGIMASDGSLVVGNTAYNNQSVGINAGKGSTVASNTAYGNQGHGIAAGEDSTVTDNTARYNQDSGIYANNGSTVTGNTTSWNNLSDTAGKGGIRLQWRCAAKGNTASYNKQNNIYVTGDDNAIEENLMTKCTSGNGIYFNSAGNFYANNRASGNVTDYNDVPGNIDGGGNVSF